MLLGEDMDVAEMLQLRTDANFKQLVANKKLVFIDEAQAIPNIGKILNLMIDNIKGITIIAIGSSRLEMIIDAGEPLVGRDLEYKLFPLALSECSQTKNRLEMITKMKSRLIYVNYP